MRGVTLKKTCGRVAPLFGATMILLFSAARINIADPPSRPTLCEVEALRAYRQALKFCQLAEVGNPRDRCYEAAKKVYVRTLVECEKSHGK